SQLLRAAETAGERLWPLPLIEEYREGLRSEVADLRNTGPRPGGAITAGRFLKEVPRGTPGGPLPLPRAAVTDTDLPSAPPGGGGWAAAPGRSWPTCSPRARGSGTPGPPRRGPSPVSHPWFHHGAPRPINAVGGLGLPEGRAVPRAVGPRRRGEMAERRRSPPG